MSAEAYLEQLKEDHDKQKGGGDGDGEGDGQFDSHEGWDEVDQQTKEIAKERLKDTLKKAAEEAANQGWGTVSQQVRKDIMDRIQTKVDWRKMMRYFVKTSRGLTSNPVSSTSTSGILTFTLGARPTGLLGLLSLLTSLALCQTRCLTLSSMNSAT